MIVTIKISVLSLVWTLWIIFFFIAKAVSGSPDLLKSVKYSGLHCFVAQAENWSKKIHEYSLCETKIHFSVV